MFDPLCYRSHGLRGRSGLFRCVLQQQPSADAVGLNGSMNTQPLGSFEQSFIDTVIQDRCNLTR